MLDHDQRDHEAVSAQLGRAPRGAWAVAHRCHLRVPTVIENHPIDPEGHPFPTLFWLTCPVLVRRISHQEAAGRMAELGGRLERDARFKRRFASAIARYRARRDTHAHIRDAGVPPGGGPDRVKCLHAHAAHELADPPNPVGALALESAGFPDCRIACVEAYR